MLGELIAGRRGEREVLGQDGLLGELTRRLVERALGEELTEHLGTGLGRRRPAARGNSRNGGTPKTLLTDHGPVRIDTPRIATGASSPSWSPRASGACGAWMRRSSRCTRAG